MPIRHRRAQLDEIIDSALAIRAARPPPGGAAKKRLVAR